MGICMKSYHLFLYDIFTNRYTYTIQNVTIYILWMSVYLKSAYLLLLQPCHFYKCYPSMFLIKMGSSETRFGQGSLEAKPWHESPAPGRDTTARSARLALSCRWMPCCRKEKHGRNVVVTGSVTRYICGYVVRIYRLFAQLHNKVLKCF